jgi:hypothetical protein
MHSFHVYRYDPDADEKPRMQVIELEVGNADRMLLDVLTRLKAIDPSLSRRRSWPNDPELHRRLPQRTESGTGHRQDQGDDGATQCMRPRPLGSAAGAACAAERTGDARLGNLG